MKQAAYLQLCRDELKRSKRWRVDEGYDDEWKRYIDLYRGKQYASKSKTDQLIVNLVFATVNTMAPAVAVNNPKFIVNARKPESAPQAVITEEVLNYAWRTYRYQDEFRLAVNDWLVTGLGWLKTGYKFTKPPEEKKADTAPNDNSIDDGGDYGIDDRDDTDGNVESEMYIYDDRPFVERISIFDMFVDPDARHPKEMCWIAQRTWRPIADVRVDDRYSPTARRQVSAKSWSRWSQDADGDARDDRASKGVKSFCEVIEFYDIKRRQVSTFCVDGDAQDESSLFLIKPKKMPYAMGQPFLMLRNYEVTDTFYPMGDVCQIESLQLELNETRTQMMNHRKRFQRKWLYEKDAFDRDGIAALESDIDNTMIPVLSDNLQNAIIPLPAVITPSEFYDQSGMISNDLDRVSGVSDYNRGGQAQVHVKRTATEAAMIQDGANSRAQDRLAKIETVLAQLGERIIGLMQQYMTGDQVARIVTMPGRAWINYDADYIQGEFDFSVAAGSTEPMNESFRRQSAMQLVDASMPFVQMGVANPQGLYMHILQKGFGIQDISNFINQPPPPDPSAAPPGTAGPQGVQGGPPPQVGGPPGGPPPPAPPGVGPPGPPSGITPEILQQLTGMGGPPPQ